MKRSWKILLSVLLAAVLLLSVWPGIADFGDFSGDSDYGGGSDWGSDYDSGSSWDYDSGSSRDYSSTRSSRSGSGSSLNPGQTLAVILLLLFMGIFALLAKSPSSRNTGTTVRRAPREVEPTWGFQLRNPDTLPPEADWNIRREKGAFCQLYRRMQEAWEAGDLSPLRGDFTPDAYAQYDRQLKAKLSRGEHAHCRVISVSASPEGWNENAHEWMLAVKMKAVIKAWNTNEDGRIVSGSNLFEKEMVYAWVLRKPKNVTEGKLHCPNCGAEVEMNAGTECPMCGAQLEAPGKGWQLSSIQGLSQKTLP